MAQSARSVTDSDERVGERIRAQRLMRQMTQIELADKLGITFQQIQKYERGTNRVAASRLLRIAKVLNTPVLFFLDGSSGNSKAKKEDNAALKLLRTGRSRRLLEAHHGLSSPIQEALVKFSERVARRYGGH